MKKYFTLALLAVASFFATPSQAQIQFGLKGGLNVTNMSLSEDVVSSSNRAGFFIGPTVKFTLPIVGLGVDASALYDQREAKIKYSEDNTNISEENIKQQAIVIPINLRYGFGLGDMASLYFFAGPQFGFNVGDKSQSLYNNVAQWKLKDSNFSVNVGAGVMLINHLQISANYNIACGKTGDFTVLNTAKSLGNGKANAWQIALAYYF
jgi:opacity protein-like surface antigen